MRRFHCQCGQDIFFDSEKCLHCDALLGFDPASMSVLARHLPAPHWLDSNDRAFKRCHNGDAFGVCNWLLPASSEHSLCLACRFNRTIPNQSQYGNRRRWHQLEAAKKRLFFGLLELGLPLDNGWDDPDHGLLLDFIEDDRWQEGVYPETFVNTGYLGGVITINTLEADDALREAQRLQMNESYRTVLGHLRHESGHYYWQRLNPDGETIDQFRRLFGDETLDYSSALARHYRDGPPADWRSRCISSYASAHPSEDWAECWGHYLHLFDALETAHAYGLMPRHPGQMTVQERCNAWRQISIILNELNRSLGKQDAYPFILNPAVEQKLAFVDDVTRRLRKPRPA